MADNKTVKINTRDFGELDIACDDIIEFPKGIFAFEDIRKFAVISPMNEEGAPMWLQNCDEAMPCFIVFRVDDIISNYKAMPLQEDLDVIKYEKNDVLEYLTIAVIPENYKKTTVNLKSPVIINKTKRLGIQAILPQNYEIKYSIYDEEGE